jgi:hypothetical protein
MEIDDQAFTEIAVRAPDEVNEFISAFGTVRFPPHYRKGRREEIHVAGTKHSALLKTRDELLGVVSTWPHPEHFA